MELNVDPRSLADVALVLADTASGTDAVLPQSWLVPAGADMISQVQKRRLDANLAMLRNAATVVFDEIESISHRVGSAAADYSEADNVNALVLGGGHGDVVDNPVGAVHRGGSQQVPPRGSVLSGAVDPLTFAKQLRAGPGPDAAQGLAAAFRSYVRGPYTTLRSSVDRAAAAMQSWTPVGYAASTTLTRYRGLLDQLGDGFARWADDVDAYGNAFRTAKAKHPAPEEIIAARKELLAAIRAEDELGVQRALAKLEELDVRSAETVGRYATETGVEISDSERSGGGGDSSSLTSMLPALLSSMAAGGLPMAQDLMSPADEYGYDEYGYDDSFLDDYAYSPVGAPSGLGGVPVSADFSPVEAADPAVVVGPMATGSALGAAASSAPRAPVIEPLNTSSAGAAHGRGAAGMPYMPYMPMAPGMGQGGGNNERNRVVAWHPDRLMYVDDTPHTEAVIGERPTIALSVTPPTPTPADPTRNGGSS
ncbi:hypothetical protein [Nocardia iowensis]|uniref:PPE domain-containing protein n=1 Tax=Nocardia iowensis TaxID=204891 RepID=A0ABX8S0R0_NOCIO|nr:hypothetical protein [Nocardia iowensis]QXN94654.1 hypothetical protein KV110_17330 [Nocardia iowensis]